MKAEWTNSDSLTTSQTTKAILVIDEMPNNCSECPCCHENECGNQYKGYVDDYIGWNSGRPSWCQLKPLPQKMKHEDEIDYEYGYIDGRNELIDEIMGETE